MIELSLEMAEKAARAAHAKAKELGTPMTVSVVDESARLILTSRGDGAGTFTTETSKAKAVAAVAFRRPTRDMVEMQKISPTFWNSIPSVSGGQVLPATGAVPILRNGRVIGAIGCGGGSAEHDHECAESGAKAIATSDA